MTKYHSIKLFGGRVETRSSKTRQYAACLVCTVSERMIALVANKLQKATQELAQKEQELAAAIQTYGDLETCRAINKQENDAYYAVWSQAMDDARKVNPRLGAGTLHDAADKLLAEKGILSPYRPNSSYTVISLTQAVEGLKDQVKAFSGVCPVVGRQVVLSWHLSVANARTARNGQLARHYMNEGWDVAIRQDFEVSDKRPAK